MRIADQIHNTRCPTLNKTLLSQDELINLNDGTIIYMLLPLEEFPSVRVIKHKSWHDRICIYAQPYNPYKETPLSYANLVDDSGPHDIGSEPQQTRMWIEEVPYMDTSTTEDEPEVFRTILWQGKNL